MLDLGYRRIDRAQRYGIEESVREAFRQSGLARDDGFATTYCYLGFRGVPRS